MTLTTLPAEVSMTHNPKTKRPIGVTRARQQVNKLRTQREEQRDTRLYAEAWYKALRDWKLTFATTPVPPSISYAVFRGSGFADPITMGESGAPQPRTLVTPSGELSEGTVGQVISEMERSSVPETVQLGRMLGRLRRQDGNCMESLLRGTSWSQNKEQAVRYAVAVLTLAVRLGDVHAERPLQQVRAELSRMAVVNSV